MAVAPKLVDPCGKRPDIPTTPLWQMSLAHWGTEASFKRLQSSVDWLTCQGKLSQPFDDGAKEFMHDLFEAFAIGGWWKDWPEASKLASHYVNGKGAPTTIDAAVYSTSVIVRETQAAMKKYLADGWKAGAGPQLLRSTAPAFTRSNHAKALKDARRDQQRQGALLVQGVLLAEQNNARLKNADNRFELQSLTHEVRPGHFHTRWSVESRYDFEPFHVGHVTHIPLGSNVLKLPDGLCEYLTHPRIDVAKAFNYSAAWTETWAK